MKLSLSNIARFITPVAMVVFLAYEIQNSMQIDGYFWKIAVIIGAVATAIGIEFVGIVSGDSLEGFLNIENNNRAIVSGIALLIYVGVSMYILRHNEALFPVPIIAAILYVVSAMKESLHTYKAAKQKDKELETQFDIEQRTLNAQLGRELKAKELELKHTEKLARIEAKSKTIKRQDSGNLAADWRQLTKEQRRELAHATREERESLFPQLATRTRREWHSRLDKIAAQNGTY
jgi:Skp family chaperone for outer membrane proteins